MQIIVRVALAVSIVSTAVPCYAPVGHIDKQRFKNWQLADAVRLGNITFMYHCIASGANINARDGMGFTVLYNAAVGGNQDIIDYLLLAGADPDKPEITHGNTTLHYAAANGLVAVTAALLNAGADPRIKNSSGYTPADVAYDKTIKNRLLKRTAELVGHRLTE